MSDGDVTSDGRARVDALLKDAREALRCEDLESALDLFQVAAQFEPERFEIEGYVDLVRSHHYELSEMEMSRYDLYTADELFLTGTAAEVVSAVRYDERVIGDGTPGPITRELTAAFRKLTETTGTPIYDSAAVT